jgi:hypothetical protein
MVGGQKSSCELNPRIFVGNFLHTPESWDDRHDAEEQLGGVTDEKSHSSVCHSFWCGEPGCHLEFGIALPSPAATAGNRLWFCTKLCAPIVGLLGDRRSCNGLSSAGWNLRLRRPCPHVSAGRAAQSLLQGWQEKKEEKKRKQTALAWKEREALM